MAGEWKQTTVGGVTDRVTKGTTPTTLGGHFVEHGISFVKVESLAEDGRILPDKLAHIDAATDALLPRSRLEKDDILFTIAGTIGRAALVPSWLLPANTNQAVAIVLENKRPSISLVQRHLRIGYNRAARLLEDMEKAGLVSKMGNGGNREILHRPSE